MFEEKKEPCTHLWCTTCVGGISTRPDYSKYSVGDECPVCLELASHGRRPEDKIGILDTVDSINKKYGEKVQYEVNKRKAEKKNRTPDGPSEIKKKLETEFSAKFKSQEQEIQSLREMILNNKPNSEQSGSGKTVTKTLKKSSE